MDLVGPTGVVAQGVERQREIDMPGVGERLAVVERFERCQFVDLRFDKIAEPQHQPATLAGIHSGPRPGFKSLPRRCHGRIDIGGIPFGHLSNRLLGGRIDRVERAAAAGRAPLAADEELGLANLRDWGSPAITGLRLGWRRGDGGRFRLCHSRFSLRLSVGERVRTVVNSPSAGRAAFRHKPGPAAPYRRRKVAFGMVAAVGSRSQGVGGGTRRAAAGDHHPTTKTLQGEVN